MVNAGGALNVAEPPVADQEPMQLLASAMLAAVARARAAQRELAALLAVVHGAGAQAARVLA